MEHEPFSRHSQPANLRVLLIDDHEISRAACRALLRTEGIDVVADLPVYEDAVAATIELHPEAAIVDVTPEDDRALVLARRLRAVLRPPIVVLTSSASRTVLGTTLTASHSSPRPTSVAARFSRRSAPTKTHKEPVTDLQRPSKRPPSRSGTAMTKPALLSRRCSAH